MRRLFIAAFSFLLSTICMVVPAISRDKIFLDCNGELQTMDKGKNQKMNYPTAVTIDSENGIVDGLVGGPYPITKIEETAINFGHQRGEYYYSGTVNRLSGRLTVLAHTKDMKKWALSMDLKCSMKKRMF